jgi:antitoxin VapB
MTEAVRTSVRERLHRVRKRPGLADRLLAIGDDAASRMSEEFRTDNPDEWLYDANGLPK